MPLTVAIVGRPNVGKSTLFNKLAGKKLALVHDMPGVTRDWREAEAMLGPLAFRFIDTAGIEDGAKESLAARMTAQTMAAVAAADVCLFMIDGREGVTAADEIVAETLRRSGKPVVLVANKCEGRLTRASVADAWSLGFGEPLAISAEHRTGLEELVDALAPFTEEGEQHEEEKVEDKPLRLAIVGRPNVGKSSLFNRLLGSERSLTGPEAGITRDAIAAHWQAGGREILLHDTAGLRKRARAAGHALEESGVEGGDGAHQDRGEKIDQGQLFGAELLEERRDLERHDHVGRRHDQEELEGEAEHGPGLVGAHVHEAAQELVGSSVAHGLSGTALPGASDSSFGSSRPLRSGSTV